jgi:DNA (cytosine-5)-methyltransferase 1
MPVTIASHGEKIIEVLEASFLQATAATGPADLPPKVAEQIARFSRQIDQQATSAFTNIITCLAATAAEPTCDPRFHRPTAGAMPAPPTGRTYFSGRSISEQLIYPWLASKGFRGSMSGWQTRVFERESPYNLDYRENIARVKDDFLGLLDAVANGTVSALSVLHEFFRLELIERKLKDATVAKLSTRATAADITISHIEQALTQHFDLPRSARLPVLALQAVYLTIMPELTRYSGMFLGDLSEHSAADVSTGSIGDIEVYSSASVVFEAVEVKHGIEIDDNIVRRSCEKIKASKAMRYYILSTAHRTVVTKVGYKLIEDLHESHGCQVVLNGVVPTIRYYLRLVSRPEEFLDHYGKLLAADRRVTRDHVEGWRESLAKIGR